MKELTISALFDLSHTCAAPLLSSVEFPWEALPKIKEFILELGKGLSPEEFDSPAEGVWISKSAKVAPNASINAPCIIGANAEIRQCAFIRGSAIVGEGAVVGNSCELKNCIREMKDLIDQDLLPYDMGLADYFFIRYEDKNYPLMHHSDIYRNAYAPAYRVVWQKQLKGFLKSIR